MWRGIVSVQLWTVTETLRSCWSRDLCSGGQALVPPPEEHLGTSPLQLHPAEEKAYPSYAVSPASPMPSLLCGRQRGSSKPSINVSNSSEKSATLVICPQRHHGWGKLFWVSQEICNNSIFVKRSFHHPPFYPRIKNNMPQEQVLQTRASSQPAEKLVGNNKVITTNKLFMTLFRGVWSQDEATLYQKLQYNPELYGCRLYIISEGSPHKHVKRRWMGY